MLLLERWRKQSHQTLSQEMRGPSSHSQPAALKMSAVKVCAWGPLFLSSCSLPSTRQPLELSKMLISLCPSSALNLLMHSLSISGIKTEFPFVATWQPPHPAPATCQLPWPKPPSLTLLRQLDPAILSPTIWVLCKATLCLGYSSLPLCLCETRARPPVFSTPPSN